MRTIISGRVTAADVSDADLLGGIVPTSFITNGESFPPKGVDLPHEVMPLCPMLPDIGERQRNYTMCQRADALIVEGENEHLLKVARQYKLAIYEV